MKTNNHKCRRCGKPAQEYSPGNFSVQCRSCNQRQSEKRRAAAKKRREAGLYPPSRQPKNKAESIGKFWMVMRLSPSPECVQQIDSLPHKRHAEKSVAVAEAKRLSAQHPFARAFVVLECVSGFSSEVKTKEIAVA